MKRSALLFALLTAMTLHAPAATWDSPAATVVSPFQPGDERTPGPIVNDAYFGQVSADRLAVKEGVACFRADANARGKIGFSPRRAKPLLGSYDAAGNALTLVSFTLPAGATVPRPRSRSRPAPLQHTCTARSICRVTGADWRGLRSERSAWAPRRSKTRSGDK